MNYRALRRALARFQEPAEKAKRHCLTRPPLPNSRQKCFEFGPDIERPVSPIKPSCPTHAVCTLKRNHAGPHCDLEHNIQWE